MNKFILVTRGRTGSTAIMDELNKCHAVWADTELFLNFEFPDDQYEFLAPFNLWKKRLHRKVSLIDKAGFLLGEKRLAKRYLDESEGRGMDSQSLAFGFKLLSHHFEERPYLADLLLNRNYRAIYLKRNLARQALSGMIANKRKIYNTIEKYEDFDQYTIDIDEFQKLVEIEDLAVINDIDNLRNLGFDHIVISYEDFCSNRSQFFQNIFNFLKIEHEVPAKSDYTIMIKDLKHTVANLEEVKNCAKQMGLDLV